MNTPYTKTEVDLMMAPIHEKLDLILLQTTKHNGRLTKLERIMIALGTTLVVLLVVNGSSLVTFISALIK